MNGKGCAGSIACGVSTGKICSRKCWSSHFSASSSISSSRRERRCLLASTACRQTETEPCYNHVTANGMWPDQSRSRQGENCGQGQEKEEGQGRRQGGEASQVAERKSIGRRSGLGRA